MRAGDREGDKGSKMSRPHMSKTIAMKRSSPVKKLMD
jgi:hypothetical protein